MLVHGASYDVFEWFDLQVAYALWQPGLALTRETTASLVHQYGVERPGTEFAYAQVLGGVYAVVLE